MTFRHCSLATFFGLALLSGCAEGTDLEGPRVAVNIAALNLPGVGDVLWDIQVVNGASDTVWQRRITSSAYGDSAGSAT